MNKYVCIVDAYSTGAELAMELHSNGYKLIHIQTLDPIPPSYRKSFIINLFEENHVASEQNLTNIVERLKKFHFEFIIAGSEPGVMIADTIAEKVGLPINPSNTNLCRRNKYHMGAALVKAKIRSIRQKEVSSLEELDIVANEWNVWPLVLKPLLGAGSDGVSFSNSIEELKKNFNSVYLKNDCFGKLNTSMLLQEFINGQQYVVNSVSIDGKHKITEIWAEYRLANKSHGNIYDYEILIPYEGEVQKQLIDYTKKVLDAVDIRNGPAHLEVMLDAKGPVLIEIAARMQGGIVTKALKEAIGDSHMTSTLKRFVNSNSFNEEMNQYYKVKKHSMVVNLISKKAGTLKENNCNKLLSTLPSFYLIARMPSIGEYVPITIDLFTKPGHIYLVHESREQLFKDYQQIRQWENDNKLLILSEQFSNGAHNEQ